jgi:hypothetical protein
MAASFSYALLVEAADQVLPDPLVRRWEQADRDTPRNATHGSNGLSGMASLK